MPVEVKKEKVTVVCDKCAESLTLVREKGAAPELAACEEVHKEHGWGYTLGFFSMLVGPQVWCGPCARPSEYPEKWEQLLWKDAVPGQRVWLKGTNDGKFKAYGPHEIQSETERTLVSGTPGHEGNKFTHLSEDLLVRAHRDATGRSHSD